MTETEAAGAQPGASARPEPDRRADYKVFLELTTRWRDNDVYGHMNNVVYYEYFDTAVNGWLIREGLLTVGDSSVIGLVVETACQFLAPVAFPDRIAAGVRVKRLGRSSVGYEVGLFRNDEDQASAQGRFVHVYVDAQSRRPAPLPDPMRAALERIAVGAG